jgi:hypothetical protein
MFLKSSLQRVVNMRTKKQPEARRLLMFTELKSALSRTAPTLLANAAGVVALVTLLVVGLSLPGIV